MMKQLSFRQIRNLGLGMLTALILLVSIFSYFVLEKVSHNIAVIVERERPVLDMVLELRNSFEGFAPYFRQYISGQRKAVQSIPIILEDIIRQAKELEGNLSVRRKKPIRNFVKEIKHLKYTIVLYDEEYRYDPASSSTSELNDITTESMAQANNTLDSLISDIRRQIAISDKRILQLTQKTKRNILLFLIIAVSMGIITSIAVNRALAKPIYQLIEGAQKVGEGDLSRQIKYAHNDEIGLLAEAFNNMTRELKDTQTQLLQSGKLAALGQLVAGVTHELKNPLGGIIGYCQFMLDKAKKSNEQLSPKDIKSYLTYIGYILRASERCKSIIQRLLDFSRPAKDKFAALDVNRDIEETLAFTQHQLEMSKVEIIRQLTPDLPPVTGDRQQLQQVFANLILNAQQAMQGGGKFTVSTFTNNGSVEIDFADTGCGISGEHLDKLFDPFFTTKKVGEGTGLGLSVSYGIIQAHQGSIEVESQLGKGTTFRIKLPIEKVNKNHHPHGGKIS